MKRYQEDERRARDESALDYDAWYVRSKGPLFERRETRLFEEEVRRLPAGRIADVGVGTGRIAATMIGHADLVVGIDFSEGSLRVMQARRPGVACIVGDTSGYLPLAQQTIDVLTACQVLQHLKREDLCRALHDIARVLRPGGRLVLSGYNGSCFRYRGEREIWHENGLYARRSTLEEQIEVAAAAGLSLLQASYYRVLPLQRLQRASWNYIDAVMSRIIGRRAASYLFAVFEAPPDSSSGPPPARRGRERGAEGR